VAEIATHGTGAAYTIRYWPFATKIWDYIYRAMPYDQAGRLTADETYALTALLLYWNGIIQENAVMDAESLPKVLMPHRSRYTVPAPRQANMPRGFTLPSQSP
jgi:cytochrome c